MGPPLPLIGEAAGDGTPSPTVWGRRAPFHGLHSPRTLRFSWPFWWPCSPRGSSGLLVIRIVVLAQRGQMQGFPATGALNTILQIRTRLRKGA